METPVLGPKRHERKPYMCLVREEKKRVHDHGYLFTWTRVKREGRKEGCKRSHGNDTIISKKESRNEYDV